MARLLASICATVALGVALPVWADAQLDGFARDVERVEGVRAVKDLQASYAQYAQYGLWSEVGALFARDGSFVFDGMVKAAETAKGPAAIAKFLRTRYGGGREGVVADGLSTMFIDAPVVNLSVDGESAKSRWQAIIFHGQGIAARIEGGVFENDYVRERGVWKIATARYFPQYDGPYEEGWINWGGGDLPVVPKHFNTETAGIPIPPAVGTAPKSKASLASLQTRVDKLNDEDRIRNLQSALGFYEDRKMWDDVVDLFAADGVVEISGQGVWRGPAGVRRWLESVGPAGLTHGQLHDRVQNDVVVTISPGGNEAFARGIELGMLGEADQEKGWWEVATFQNRFVREAGVWKFREMRRFVVMKTDIFQGWGKNRIVEPAPAGAHSPDAPVPSADSAAPGLAMPAFLAKHPVTGKAVKPAGSAKLVANNVLTGAIAPSKAPAARNGAAASEREVAREAASGADAPDNAGAAVSGSAPRGTATDAAGSTAPSAATPAGGSGRGSLADARRRLARSAAYDGAANVSAAYGYYVDDSDAAGWAGVMASKGFKQTPFQGYHIGRGRLIAARVKGKGPEKQAGISYHWLLQPVVLVSDDGRSATGRFRLFQPRTGKTVGKAGDFFAAQFWGGMYHDRYVLENGVWRIWELTLDEPYITPVAWKDGVWAKSKDPAPGTRRPPSNTVNVDIALTTLGKREEHFAGGTGESQQWPTILPMWFTYTNPVTGRKPELHQPDCVPCATHPELNLDRNSYQEPPDAPAANRSP